MSEENKDKKCGKCKCYRYPSEFLKKGRVLKTCIKCRDIGAKSREKNKCAAKSNNNELIYPITIRHYMGSISATKKQKFSARIRLLNISTTCDTYDKAFKWIKKQNIIYNLDIKNIIHDMSNHFEVEISQNNRMLFDKDDLQKIQTLLIYADVRNNTSYARAHIYKQSRVSPPFLHNMIMNYKPRDGLTVDHINGDGLDNRKSNMRIVTQSVQCANRLATKNSTGFVGISRITNGWAAEFAYNKERYRKNFTNKDDSVEWLHKKKIEIIPEYDRITRVLL